VSRRELFPGRRQQGFLEQRTWGPATAQFHLIHTTAKLAARAGCDCTAQIHGLPKVRLGMGVSTAEAAADADAAPRCLTTPGTVPSQLGALMLRFLEPSATASRTMPSFDCCGRSFPVKSSRVHMTKSWLLFRQEPCSLPVLRAFHLATLNGGSFLALLKDRGDQPPICVCQVRKRKRLISHLPSR